MCIGGVFVTSHIEQRRKFLALYQYGLLLTPLTRFQALRVTLGLKRIIATWLSAHRYTKCSNSQHDIGAITNLFCISLFYGNQYTTAVILQASSTYSGGRGNNMVAPTDFVCANYSHTLSQLCLAVTIRNVHANYPLQL